MIRFKVFAFSLLLLVACSGANGGAGSADSGTGGAGSGGAGTGDSGTGGSGTGGSGAGGTGGRNGTGGGSGGAVDGGSGSGGSLDGGGDIAISDSGGGTPFAAVQAIIQAKCVRCHDPAHPFVPETQTFVAMDLTAPHAYANLVNKRATETCGGVLVVPGSPTSSYLYAKVSQDTPCDGQRMPHQGMLRTPPLPADEIATIERWIRDGAQP